MNEQVERGSSEMSKTGTIRLVEERAAPGESLPGQAAEAERERRRGEIRRAVLDWFQAQGGPGLPPEATYPVPPSQNFYDPYAPDGERNFIPAPDLEEIAIGLTRDWEELAHLQNYRLVYLWKRKGGQRSGMATLGACAKASGVAKHLSDATWIVWLAADWSRDFELTRHQVEAAVYHELLHAGEKEVEMRLPTGQLDSQMVPAVRGHDCEMFGSEVEHYGLWRPPLETVAPAFRQLALFGGQEEILR